MYWRAGVGRAVLWIAALTCLLSAFAALILVGSTHAAEALAVVGAVFLPPVQEWVAARFHVRAPAQLAFYAVITMLPVAAFFIVIDGVATLEALAARRGFASAAQMQRAQSLNLTTPAALAAHDERILTSQRDKLCGGKPLRLPMLCYEPPHRAAALAYANDRLRPDPYQVIVHNALNEQRQQFLAADRSCLALLDRIDDEAAPEMIEHRDHAVEILASLWAGRLDATELGALTVRAKASPPAGESSQTLAARRKAAAHEMEIDRLLAQELKSWSQNLVLVPSGWRALFGIKPQPDHCKMVETTPVR